MKKVLTLSLVAGISILMANCSHKTHKAVSNGNSPEMNKAAEIKAKYTDAQINEGMGIYQANCNKCHKLYEPTDFPMSKWEAVLPPMSKKAKLSDEQAGLVRAYVLTHIKM
jgi:mono/diheme cytochrome c family protein